MSKKLVQPKYYVYKLTFQSGRTYIGYHKQIKEQDYYITSSTYYERHKQDDPLVNREILIETDDDFKASFLETWCILSDKAYSKETNVNYNLGNFFHRFSFGYRTPEEIAAITAKAKITRSLKTPEEKALISQHISDAVKRHYTEHPDAREQMSDIKKEWWASLTEKELIFFREHVSKSRKDFFAEHPEVREWLSNTLSEKWASLNDEEYIAWCHNISEARKEFFAEHPEAIEEMRARSSITSKAYHDEMRSIYGKGFSPSTCKKISESLCESYSLKDDDYKKAFAERARNVWSLLSEESVSNAKEKMSVAWAKRTPEEKRMIQDKVLATKGQHRIDRTPVSKEERAAHFKETWSKKSEEEIAEWKRKTYEGNKKHFEENRALYGTALTPETRKKISESRKGQKLSEETKLLLGEKTKERFSKMTDDERRAFVERCKKCSKKSKKVRCIETDEVFDSLSDAAEWLGSPSMRNSIRLCINGNRSHAGKHPITNEPLHWELV